MKIIILIISMSLSVIVNKNLSFYGFLQTNQFDKELSVGMDVEEFPSKIVFFQLMMVSNPMLKPISKEIVMKV